MTRLAAPAARLDRLEARRGSGRIASVVNLAGHPSEIVAAAVREPRAWIADGRARRRGSTLILLTPTLTLAGWSARHVPQHGSPS